MSVHQVDLSPETIHILSFLHANKKVFGASSVALIVESMWYYLHISSEQGYYYYSVGEVIAGVRNVYWSITRIFAPRWNRLEG